MESAFELFPVHKHLEKWQRALAVKPEVCPGKDPEDTKCTCTDLVYSTRVRLRTGQTFASYIYCGCCDLPVIDDRTAPGGAVTPF